MIKMKRERAVMSDGGICLSLIRTWVIWIFQMAQVRTGRGGWNGVKILQQLPST